MNKTLLNFTATALLSTLLAHPCVVVAMDKKVHTSIVIEDSGERQCVTQSNSTNELTIAKRDHQRDWDSAATVVQYQSCQTYVDAAQEAKKLLDLKNQCEGGTVLESSHLAEATRLIQPDGPEGSSWAVTTRGVEGYDVKTQEKLQAVPAAHTHKGSCWKTPYPWIAGAGIAAGTVTLAVLCAKRIICPESCNEETDEPGTALATLEANMTTAASNLTTLAATVITPLALPLLTTVKSLLTSTEAPSTLPQGIDSSMTPELLDALTTEEKTPELTTTTEEVTSTSTTTPKPKRQRKGKKNRKVKTTTTTTPAPTTASTSTTEPTTTTEEVTSTSTSTPESTTTLAHTTASTSTTKFVEGNQNPSSQVPQCMATFHTQWMQSVQQSRDVFLAQCQQVINQKQLVRCKWQYRQKVRPYMQRYNEHLKPCIKEYSMQLMQKISSNNSGRLPEKDLQTIQQSNQQQINEACQRIEQKLSSHVQQWNGSINNRYANSYNAQQFVEDMRQYSQTLLKEITDDFTQLTRNMWTHNDGQLIAYRTAYQQQQAVQRRLQ
ncbi:MAG: hypothetical protein ACPG7U_03455 [Holosporaceae bacterium]